MGSFHKFLTKLACFKVRMGKQIVKVAKKEMVEPDGDDPKSIPSSSLCSWFNIFLFVISVVVAVVITAVITKAVELQDMNVEKDITINTMGDEIEELKQQMYKAVSDGRQQLEAKENKMKKFTKDIEILNKDKNFQNKEIEEKEKKIKNLNSNIVKLNNEKNDNIEEIGIINQQLDDKSADIEELKSK